MQYKKRKKKEDYVCSYTRLFWFINGGFFFYRNITVLRTVLNKAKRVFTLLFWIFALRLDAVGEECGDFCDELIQDEVRKECGSQNGTKLYCRSFYYCCNADTATCCGAGHICSGATCISIA